MPPSAVADAYWQLYQQPKSAWTFEMEIRPFRREMVTAVDRPAERISSVVPIR